VRSSREVWIKFLLDGEQWHIGGTGRRCASAGDRTDRTRAEREKYVVVLTRNGVVLTDARATSCRPHQQKQHYADRTRWRRMEGIASEEPICWWLRIGRSR
jgi:hypothetical protein